MNKEEQFLQKYKNLCLEYGLEIMGCGCCGSAFLNELNKEEIKHSKLCWKKDYYGNYTNIKFAGDYEMDKNNIIKL